MVCGRWASNPDSRRLVMACDPVKMARVSCQDGSFFPGLCSDASVRCSTLQGARFAKWRAVVSIPAGPSPSVILSTGRQHHRSRIHIHICITVPGHAVCHMSRSSPLELPGV